MTERDIAYWRGYARQCAMGLGLRGDDADDAAQEAVIALHGAWGDAAEDPRAYRSTVAANAVRMYARRESLPTRDCAPMPDPIPAPDPWSAVDERLVAESWLAEALASPAITPRQREVLRLRAEGNSMAEIAAALGTTEGSAKWSAWDARRRLTPTVAGASVPPCPPPTSED